MKKVLFIGNSHTYFNDMAGIFMCIANENEDVENVEVAMLAHPYVTLDYHKEQAEVRFNILYGNYDYVVIQQGAHPFKGEEELIENGKAINEFIKEAGATPVAYMTWAKKDEPENQEEMTKAYKNFAKEINGILAPVGEVFRELKEENIRVYHSDGGHASKIGSYVAAITLLKSMFNIDIDSLPSKVEYKGKVLCNIEGKAFNSVKNAVKNVCK